MGKHYEPYVNYNDRETIIQAENINNVAVVVVIHKFIELTDR